MKGDKSERTKLIADERGSNCTRDNVIMISIPNDPEDFQTVLMIAKQLTLLMFDRHYLGERNA